MKLFATNRNDHEVLIFVPLKTKGKFRWKNRRNHNEYGVGFATSTNEYTANSYVEWQIGYDVEASKTSEKPTTLTDLTFIGDNKKVKHPYELSEILYQMKVAGLVTSKEILALLNDNLKQNMFLDKEYKIKTNHSGKEMIGGLLCDKQIISLPTFAYANGAESPVIEISIQKQQYASGVQPMLYLSIPLKCFENWKNFVGKTSNDFNEPYVVLKIDKKNKNFVLNTFRLFACCSKRHKYDVNEILKLIANYR